MFDTIEAYAKWSRVAKHAEQTVDRRVRLLRHADKRLPYGLYRAIPAELIDYLDSSEWSAWTHSTYDTYLRGYFRWAVEEAELPEDPMFHVPRPPEGDRLPNPCTDAELVHLLTRAPEKPWRLAFLLAAYNGLRVSEAARLCREHITEEHIRVIRGKGRGGGKDSVIDTHPIIWEAVKDLPRGTRDAPGYVVRDPDGEPVTGYQLINRGYYLYRSLGLPEMRFHRLRHWHATTLLREGADLETVRQCMRHENISSTARYTLIDSRRRRAAVHRLPLVVSGPAVIRPGDATEAA